MLLVVLTDQNGIQYNFPYQSVKIEGEAAQYKLVLGDYIGRLVDRLGYSNHTTFKCWQSQPSRRTRVRGYYEYHSRSCYDNGHLGSGCWWFGEHQGRYCGMNNLHAVEPYWNGISLKSVLIKVKRDEAKSH